MQDNHQAALDDTENHMVKEKTIQNYCNRLDSIITWIKSNYIDYYNNAVVELTPTQKQNKAKYHNSTHDLDYSSLNPEILKAFISANKMKPCRPNEQQKHYSFGHMRKYKDAIQYGAYRAGQVLPNIWETKMSPFMASLKKENTRAKKEGKLDEEEADPIPFSLYRLICEYAIKKGD